MIEAVGHENIPTYFNKVSNQSTCWDKNGVLLKNKKCLKNHPKFWNYVYSNQNNDEGKNNYLFSRTKGRYSKF